MELRRASRKSLSVPRVPGPPSSRLAEELRSASKMGLSVSRVPGLPWCAWLWLGLRVPPPG